MAATLGKFDRCSVLTKTPEVTAHVLAAAAGYHSNDVRSVTPEALHFSGRITFDGRHTTMNLRELLVKKLRLESETLKPVRLDRE